MKKLLILLLIGNFLSLNAMKRPHEQEPRDLPAQEEQGGLAAKVPRVPIQQETAGQPSKQMQALLKELQEQANLGKLPDEILAKILLNLAKEKVSGANEDQKLYNAIANIRAFMKVFPQFYKDIKTTGELIQELANRYASGNRIKVAIALATVGAGQWLAELVKNDQKRLYIVGRELIHAAEYHDLGKVNFILEYVNAAAQQRDNHNTTALIRSAVGGGIAIVNRLLKAPGIDVNAQDKDGGTALMQAAYNGHTAVVERLLQVPGINVNMQGQAGVTALMVAARNGRATVVERLLQAPGINVNAQDKWGTTALMQAAYNGHTAVVERLLQVPGINVNARDESGRTALKVVRESASPEKDAIVKLLLAHGATE